MSFEVEVAWSINGSSTVHFSDEQLEEAVRLGYLDPEDSKSLDRWINQQIYYDTSFLEDDYDDKDGPLIEYIDADGVFTQKAYDLSVDRKNQQNNEKLF